MITHVWLKDGNRIDFTYATTKDVSTIKGWSRFSQEESNPRKLDAIEFAASAIQKWRDLRKKHRVARSMREIEVFVKDNPYSEVAALIVAKAVSFKRMKLLGLCLFRRTWAHNIYLDYIAVHPLLVENPRRPIRGLGPALLYYVSCLAAELKSTDEKPIQAIWGETTQNSVEFYRGLLEGKNIQDLLYLNKEEYTLLRNGLKSSLLEPEE